VDNEEQAVHPECEAPQRVVVTGLGVVTSIGVGVAEFAAGLRAGRSEVRPITAFDTTGYRHSNGCEVVDFDPGRWIDRVDPDELGRASQFSVSAAKMAVIDAGMSLGELRSRRVLVSVGTNDGECRDLDTLIGVQVAHGPEHLDGRIARRSNPARISSGVVRELALSNVEAVTIPTACAAGNYAIGHGFDAIRTGDVDVALCGGADAVCRKTFTGFYRFGTIAPQVCQPFDRDRKGILTGEGAGVLQLESLRSARQRGARIYAEVLGYGLNCDAHHPVAPDVDLISAHGTGTPANDVTETGAIRQVFDEPPPTISIKGMIGHSMGAASALSAAACALAIREGFIPPTINHHTTDPECGLDCVPNKARPAMLNVVQNNALAFGGNNAVLIFGRYR
jgi:3-oxoacyl-[acyl-carrier-protein] synthase II